MTPSSKQNQTNKCKTKNSKPINSGNEFTPWHSSMSHPFTLRPCYIWCFFNERICTNGMSNICQLHNVFILKNHLIWRYKKKQRHLIDLMWISRNSQEPFLGFIMTISWFVIWKKHCLNVSCYKKSELIWEMLIVMLHLNFIQLTYFRTQITSVMGWITLERRAMIT